MFKTVFLRFLGIFPFLESESWSMKNDAAACVKCCLNVMERSKMIEWVNNVEHGNISVGVESLMY